MNVSQKGYFTSDYLDRRKNRSVSTFQSESSLMSPAGAGLEDNISPISSNRSEDPDYLDKAPTPANLNYLYKKNQRSVDYLDYFLRRKNRKPVHDGDSSYIDDEDDLVFQLPKKAPTGYQGYYIDQKKRYEEAEEIKPRNFTHKTFMDVFDRDADERFNPIDVVFDDPEKVREQENKRKLTKVMKTVQKKVGMNDYNSYDYYTQTELHNAKMAKLAKEREAKLAKQEEKEAKKARQVKKSFKLDFSRKKKEDKAENQELFVEHVSDDSDDEEMEGYDDLAQNQSKKKAWKRKWKNAKKVLSDDYFDSYNRDIQTRKQIKVLAQEDQSKEAEPEQSAGYVGPKDGFHPLWNYMLSWLVYSSVANTAAKDDKIVEIERTGSNSTGKKKRRKSTTSNLKNYKTALKRWNDPASKYFTGARSIAESKYSRSDSRALQPYDCNSQNSTMDSVYPDEIELSDDGNLSDEFVIGDESIAQYLGGPPTSALAMRTGSRLALHEGNPVKIVSNINQLIKRIKIMKIIFAPIDIIAVSFPSLQTIVILVELVIFMWILYELSLLIDALCMAVKAVCAPMIAIGKFMNRIV